jgi:hypothetical protein
MSHPIQSMPTPTGEFQAHFGGPPGSSDVAADCKKWENLCGDLLAERQSLREELAQVRDERDAHYRELMRRECENYVCPYTKEELFANAVYEPSIEKLLGSLQRNEEG